jgi:hypothetical protein
MCRREKGDWNSLSNSTKKGQLFRVALFYIST